MKRLIALFLVFSIIGLYGNLYAKEKRGAELVIQKTDGQQVKGELIAVKHNSLLLKEQDSGADSTVVLSVIKIITIVKKSKALKQGGMGLLIGGAVGVAACSAFLYIVPGFGLIWEEIDADEIFVEYALPYGLIGGGTIGALIGIMTGASAGKDEIIQIEGKPAAEIKRTLDDLRKKARVPDFQ